MKALLGFIQMGSIIAGVVALFSGMWLTAVGALVFAGLVGIAGDRIVRRIDGISVAGRDAMGFTHRALGELERGDYQQAVGSSRAAVRHFRMGGEKALLPFALTVHAAALAATRDVRAAEATLTEASMALNNVPLALATETRELRESQALLHMEIRNGVPDPARLVADFLEIEESPRDRA